MPSRARDWLEQAHWDLEHARRSAEVGHHDWACFAAQQAAEKAVKAVIQAGGGEARGHAVRALLASLPASVLAGSEAAELAAAGRELDRHSIPARYPNSVPEGAPHESYDERQSATAIAAAERVLRFCDRHVA